MANVLKLLRNNELFATHEAALANVTSRAQSLGDGEVWVATYGVSPNAKSILAVKRTWGVTIFDTEAMGSDVDDKIAAAIEALNLANIATSGLASDAATTPITGSSSTVAVTGNNAAEQIASLATTLKSVQDNASKYKIVKLTAAEVTALSDENVKEAYKLVSFQGEETAQTVYTQVGDVIKIYKDSSLAETYLGSGDDTVNSSTAVVTKYAYELISDPTTKITAEAYNELTAEQKALYEPIDTQSLNFVYQLADGTYQLVKVDVSKFLSESEFGSGLDVTSGVVSVKVDSTSAGAENFISVGPDGVKISGVQNAINSALGNVVGGLDAEVKGSLDANDDTKVATGKHVGVKIVEQDGVLTSVTVVEDDIASASSLDDLDLTVSAALNDLESRKADKTDLDDLEGDMLEAVVAGNGINVSTKANNSQTVSVKLDTVQTDNALSVGSDGLYFSKTIDCGDY